MNREKKFAYKLAIIPLAISMALMSGCGDDENSSSSSPSPNTSQLSGVAYDGYLRDAQVCADVNRNRACDSNEKSTMTTAGGAWTLNLTSTEAAAPILLQATQATIDEDTNDNVDLPLVYSAPAGSTAISAFTTIIQNTIDRNLALGGNTANSTNAQLTAQANEELLTALGLSGSNIDLTEIDIIAAKNDEALDETQRLDFAKLHILNQELTEHLTTVIPQAQANGTGDDNDAAALNATITNVALNLPNVVSVLNTATASMALQDLLEVQGAEIVAAPLPPVPTTEQVQQQAEIDRAAQQAAGQQPTTGTDTPAPPTGGTIVSPPPGTGGNNGTDGTTDETDGITDEVDDITNDIIDETDDITNDIIDETDDITNDITDEIDDITNEIGDETDDITNDITDEIDDITNEIDV